VLSLSTTSSLGFLPDVRAALATIPGCAVLPDDTTFLRSQGKGKWDSISFVHEQLEEHGFHDIEVETFFDPSTIASAAGFIRTFTPSELQLMKLAWNDDDHNRYGDRLTPALSGYLNSKYG
jgi:hypothetical protein